MSFTLHLGQPKNWRALFRAASAETDNARASQRMLEAEHAVIDRMRELFYAPGNKEEKDELKIDLCKLHALRSAPGHLEKAA